MSDHAVIVWFQYGQQDLAPMFAVQDRLTEAIEAAGVGEFDGNEIADDGSDGSFSMYGPDADGLFAAVERILRATPFLAGAVVVLRYGPPDPESRETKVVL